MIIKNGKKIMMFFETKDKALLNHILTNLSIAKLSKLVELQNRGK